MSNVSSNIALQKTSGFNPAFFCAHIVLEKSDPLLAANGVVAAAGGLKQGRRSAFLCPRIL